jgi:hypothetical protein
MSTRDSSLDRFAAAVLGAIGAPAVEAVIKRELEHLDPGHLPLQQGLAGTSYAFENKISAMVIRVADGDQSIRIRAGLFYTGILSGCSCADDPTPVEEQNEYCEVSIEIDKAGARARISLVRDSDPAF